MRYVLAIVLGLTGPAAADALRIGTDPTFAPYIFFKGGQLSGMDRDVMDEVSRRAALDCTWSQAPFDALIPAIRADQIDVAIAGLANSPSRRKLVDFTVAYDKAVGPSFYVGMPGAPDLATARIGVKGGTIHADHLAAKRRKATLFKTEAAALDALVAGKIDLYFGPNSYLLEAQKADRRGWTILHEEPVAAEGAAIALRKGNRALQTRLDSVLTAMRNDGTLRRLSRKWFD